MNREEIAKRVPSLAASLLTEKGFVAPVDLLLKLDWLKLSDYEAWRRGRIPYLERVVSGNLSRLSYAMSQLRRYAQNQHLRPSWTAYVSWGARQPLRFSRSGDPGIERLYATHWLPNAQESKPLCGATNQKGNPPAE